MDKRHVIRNIRSNQVVDGSPKLPTSEQILHGEIAINFAKEHETLSLKNDNDEIVAFELRSVSNLDEKLNEEIERAQTSEQANAVAITAEETRASQKEKEISDLLGTKTDTKDKDTAFGRIAKEINDRTNAINSLDATVGTTSVEIGKHVAVQVIETDGKLTTLTVTENDIASAAALAQEIERAQTAEQVNATAITAEETRATAAESANATAIATETTRATTAEEELKTDVDKNKADINAANTAISNEVTRAKAAEAELTTKLTDEVTRAKAAESANATAIATEKERAEHVESDLLEKINKNTADIQTISTGVADVELRKEGDLSYALYVNGTKHGEFTIPKDQFLKSVTYDPTTRELVFVFNTSEGETTTRVSIADLVDVYTAGDGLVLNSNAFSVNFTTVASVEAMQAAVNAETTRATTEEGKLKADIEKNKTDIANAKAVADKAASDLVKEVERATSAESANAQAVITEKERAMAAESVLDGKVSNVKTIADGANATATKAASDLVKEIERATAAEQANATAITAEETRASQKEKEISDLLGTKTDTKDKDTAFGRIAKEINDRTNAINSLDATVGATSVESGKHVAVQVVETDGKLTALTVTENDIASAAALAQEIERAQTAIAQEVTDRNTAIDSAIDALDKSETTASAENAHVTVKYSETNGIVSMNVTESDIASAQGLADEITRATNSENTIKETYLKNISINGIDGEFSDNVSNLTVKGKDIVLSNEYTIVEYPSSFNNRASHVNASDTIDSAFHHVESTIKTLSEDIITNELTTANSISSLAEVVGVMTVDDAIVYEKNTNTNYLSEASSVHHATLILDNKIKELEEKTNNVEIKDVKVNGNSVVAADKTAYINLSATNIPITAETSETSTIYSELNSIKNDCSRIENALQNKTNDLTNKIIEDELISANSINALVEASGLVSSNNEITYTKKANPYYIGEASSLSDAINILDENLNIVQKLIETSVKKAITDLINANPSLNMNNPFEMPNT